MEFDAKPLRPAPRSRPIRFSHIGSPRLDFLATCSPRHGVTTAPFPSTDSPSRFPSTRRRHRIPLLFPSPSCTNEEASSPSSATARHLVYPCSCASIYFWRCKLEGVLLCEIK